MINLSQIATNYNLIMIELTNCCNLDCEYCYRSRMNLKGKMLTEEEFLLRLNRIKKNSDILFCGMGEQLIHPQFYHFINLAKQHNIQLVTNGTIPLNVKELSKCLNVQSITFSVDGADQETVLKSCSGYKFNILIQNLEKLEKQGRIMKAINFVVSESNLEKFREMADFCDKYQVNSLNLLLPTTDLKWVGTNYNIIHKELISLKTYVKENSYKLYVNMPDTRFCIYNGAITPYISVEGYVRPCCSHDCGVKVVGQIKKDTMKEIMEGDLWKTFVAEFDCSTCSMNQYHFSFE